MDNKRLTWAEIVKKYPHQNVGLVDVETGINEADIKSAVVKCTDKDMSYLAHLRDERRAGISEGVTIANNNNAKAMLSDGVPASRIAKYTNLSLGAIHTLARDNNLPFVDK